MPSSREGLRPILPKEKELKKTKTNAEKCRDYKARIRASPGLHRKRLDQNKASSKNWRLSQTEEQRQRTRELARIRQQKRRERLKRERRQIVSKNPSACSLPPKRTKSQVCQYAEELTKKREDARLRQARRREKVRTNPQLYQLANEKRRKRYLAKKQQVIHTWKAKTQGGLSLSGLLSNIKAKLKQNSSKYDSDQFVFLTDLLE